MRENNSMLLASRGKTESFGFKRYILAMETFDKTDFRQLNEMSVLSIYTLPQRTMA